MLILAEQFQTKFPIKINLIMFVKEYLNAKLNYITLWTTYKAKANY